MSDDTSEDMGGASRRPGYAEPENGQVAGSRCKSYEEGDQLKNSEALKERIVKALEDISEDAKSLLAVSRPKWTKCLKMAMAKLGGELGYEVAASGCEGAQEGEWLYDMSWFILDHDKKGMFLSQPMVLECEHDPDPNLDGDFHKLVQARADVRVWIFTAANVDAVNTYMQRCQEQARAFAGSMPGDQYVCVGFDWLKRDVTIGSFGVR